MPKNVDFFMKNMGFLRFLVDREKDLCYSIVEDTGLFFMYKKISSVTEVEILRTRITLACTECKQRNYSTTKDKKVMPDRMEIKKYCKFCKAHTLHKETK